MPRNAPQRVDSAQCLALAPMGRFSHSSLQALGVARRYLAGVCRPNGSAAGAEPLVGSCSPSLRLSTPGNSACSSPSHGRGISSSPFERCEFLPGPKDSTARAARYSARHREAASKPLGYVPRNDEPRNGLPQQKGWGGGSSRRRTHFSAVRATPADFDFSSIGLGAAGLVAEQCVESNPGVRGCTCAESGTSKQARGDAAGRSTDPPRFLPPVVRTGRFPWAFG